MKTRLIFFAKFYATLVLTFLSAKLLCLAYNGWPSLSDVGEVLLHGLPLDLNVAAYASAPLWLALLVGLVVRGKRWARFLRIAYRVYAYVLTVMILLTVIVDTILYSKWGFKLDAVCLSYLDNPSGVTESLNIWFLLGAVVLFGVLIWGYSRLLLRLYPAPEDLSTHRTAARKSLMGGLLVVVGALLFLAIRGGVGKSTANVGMVYYSTRQYLNHSAVNPLFSFFYSLMKEKDFSKQAQYFSPEEADRIFASLHYNTKSRLLPADSLLTTTRPNVLLILMESCGGRVVGCTEGTRGVTPTLDSLSREGVFFSRCYANSFRTDRGTICTFSGYPAFPDASVMKMPAKSRVLPSIAGSLKRVGYDTEFLYGGDKNFTNMNSYFLATGYDRVLGDADFPESMRHTHVWGVTDHLMFGQLSQRIAAMPQGRPWFKTLLTLSSHEPWEVPHHALEDPILNAFHYLDHSIAGFLKAFRRSPQWKNTLIIILPDHGVTWPSDINEFDTRKYHIPMIWAGGAVKAPRRVDVLCNQTDLAATLLGQLELPHSEFRFSRDVLSQTYVYPCAQHSWPEGFTFIDSTGTTIYTLATREASRTTPDPTGVRLNKAKAFMQKAYRDLEDLR